MWTRPKKIQTRFSRNFCIIGTVNLLQMLQVLHLLFWSWIEYNFKKAVICVYIMGPQEVRVVICPNFIWNWVHVGSSTWPSVLSSWRSSQHCLGFSNDPCSMAVAILLWFWFLAVFSSCLLLRFVKHFPDIIVPWPAGYMPGNWVMHTLLCN